MKSGWVHLRPAGSRGTLRKGRARCQPGFTQEGLRQLAGKGALTDPDGANKQESMREPALTQAFQPGHNTSNPDGLDLTPGLRVRYYHDGEPVEGIIVCRCFVCSSGLKRYYTSTGPQERLYHESANQRSCS